MSKETVIKYTPNETKNYIKNLLGSNEVLLSQGKNPVALSIEGEHGIGKTTVVEEAAKEVGYHFLKLNMAQFQEPADLIGYSAKLYEVEKGGIFQWVPENMVPKFALEGFHMTNRIETKSCAPDWIQSLQDKTVICLDDYLRANQLLIQASMELIDKRQMPGWVLPNNVQIIMTNNPEEGYNVASTDEAQKTRYATIHMKWDVKDWAERAEKMNMDSRTINFVLSNSELFENKKQDGISASGQVVPRILDKFLDLVSTIPDFSKNLALVKSFGDSTVKGHVSSMFIKFIHNKLDLLPSPKELLELPTEKGLKLLEEVCGSIKKKSSDFRSATASILALRLANYTIYNKISCATKGKTDSEGQKLLHFLNSDSFSDDQKFIIINKISMNHSTNTDLFSLIMSNPKFLKLLGS